MNASNALVFIVSLLAVPVIWGIMKFNEFVTMRNRFQNAFAQIDVQLKRRHDLIPNVVNATRAYLQQERGTVEAVASARQAAITAQSRAKAHPGEPAALAALEAAESTLSGHLGRLYAVVEAYPELRANESVARLCEELTSTENRIAFARQAFNDQVTSYNTGIDSFPSSVVARLCGFPRAATLRATRAAKEREPVAVTLQEPVGP